MAITRLFVWKKFRLARLSKRFICCAAVLFALSLVGCQEKGPSAYEGRIYYTLYEAGSSRIQWMDQNGGQVHEVVGGIIERNEFTGDPINPEKYDTSTVKDTRQARCPSISRDGKKMVYLLGSPSVIAIQDLVSNNLELTCGSKESYSRPSYSRVDNSIAYMRTSTDKGRCQIVVQTPPKSPKVVFEAVNLGAPAWSNLGSIVYFADYNVLNEYAAYSLDVKTQVRKKLFDSGKDFSMAPSGAELAVILDNKLQVYDCASKRTRLIVDEPGISSPTWNPAGTVLAYVKDEKVYTVGREGGVPKQIGDPSKRIIDVCWGKGPN